ncbi:MULTISPECIES: thioredoxin family protein [Sanguibacteroides]|uniref:Thioredoxin n=1 Tax=Sanguibacteroides justesenii TaxID=1547597 RepID=A0A0C3RDH3_9PORP|nr:MULTISPECIES: thioredoxin family protein [Sanguibacteroides]KIO44296.1 thioredoxin [Sanguibacteroides justesenii]
MKKIVFISVFLMGILGSLSAQMVIFEGSFDEAMKKAKEEKKDLFVDFYADWCGPCKMMAEQVFTRPEVGEYFNSRFICVKVNVDAKENKELAKRYNVTALPTMVFVGRDGKEMRRITGTKDPASFVKEARIAKGEALSFEQLYEQYKKKKKDVQLSRQLLLEAPTFVSAQQGYDQQKWIARVDNLYAEYMKNNKLDHMITEPDFMILTMYHAQTGKKDPVFDFVAANFDQYAKVVGKEVVAGYLMGLNNSYIIRLCKKGDLSYKDRLARVNGDLQKVYAGISFGSLSVQDAVTLLADATYSLYRRDEDAFFKNMNKYFAGKGDQADVNDYTQPLEDLFTAYEGKLSENAYSKCIPWIGKALEKKMDSGLRTRLLIMMGQCFQHTGQTDKAKQSFNQAFLTSTQIENKMMMKQLQQVIKQSLENL